MRYCKLKTHLQLDPFRVVVSHVYFDAAVGLVCDPQRHNAQHYQVLQSAVTTRRQ